MIELYIPRKCSATNRLITSQDHGSVQINIAHINSSGTYDRATYSTFALCGFIRKKGAADAALNRLAAEKKLIKDLTKFATADKFKTESE